MGFFNQDKQREQLKINMNEIEKIMLKVNAHEVHIKRLLNFENEIRRSMSHSVERSKKEKASEHRKFDSNQRSHLPDLSKKTSEIEMFFKKKIDELARRVDELEQFIQDHIPSIEKRHLDSLKIEKQVEDLVESLLAQKFADMKKNEENLQAKIRMLEDKVSKMIEVENEQTQVQQGSGFDESEFERLTAEQSRFDGDVESESEEYGESVYFEIQQRLLSLEQNYRVLNEGQALLLRQVNDLMGKCTDYQNNNGKEEHSDPAFRTLYIDKLYLDKYEQNNNFAQLGINHLSGALNIGATYGSVPMPIAEQVQDDIAKMKQAKEEMENQTKPDQSSDPMDEESTANNQSYSPETEMPFTEIQIEDSFTDEESSSE
ncbi:hypothetical protein R4Z09_18385 [Niallia oryzisoli]|uniref:Uncharacterized protein n=1 Tax=Niallia oryzisoli TaxID=1737571 RepID=A0ABZ2CBG6_9BACI